MAANPSLGRVMGYEFGKKAGTDLSRPARPVWAAATRRPDGGVGRSTPWKAGKSHEWILFGGSNPLS